MQIGRRYERPFSLPLAVGGTGFLPAPNAMPEELLPLVDKPLIQYGVEEVVKPGIRELCIVTGPGKVAIEDHFEVSSNSRASLLLESRMQNHPLQVVRAISDQIDAAYRNPSFVKGYGVRRSDPNELKISLQAA